MKIIIRDDDFSYFSDPKLISELYAGIWDKYPIHFATVPKIYTRQNEIKNKEKIKKDYYWIHENRQLVNFVKKKIQEKKIVIWQHGFTHKNYGDKFELERTNLNVIYKELKTGKEALEKTFKIKIDTLVAPHDRFSKQAIIAAEKIGYKYICRGYSPLPREFILRKEYFINFTKLFLFWLKHKTELRYPDIMDFGRHKEILSYRIQHIKNIEKIVNFTKSHNGILCITLHHQYATKEMISTLKETLKRLNWFQRS